MTAHSAAANDAPWLKTACILCENNCGIQVQLDGRRLAKIRGDKEHVTTHGYTCNKALRLDHHQNGGVRLTSPLRREPDGSWTEIDCDTAIREVAAKLKKVRATHGGKSAPGTVTPTRSSTPCSPPVPGWSSPRTPTRTPGGTTHADGRIPLVIPELLGLPAELPQAPTVHTSAEFPIVLSAGQRRSFTANTIFRDNTWRRRDASGSLRISPHDAEQFGLVDGAAARVTTSRGSAEAVVGIDERMQSGHAALPNGFGLDLPTGDGGTERIGVSLNTPPTVPGATTSRPLPGTSTSPPGWSR